MPRLFEELDYQETPLGAISLRRRADLMQKGGMIYEIKLDDEFLMSSLFTTSETQLAKLGLAAVEGDALDVVVGGLGLGYTAATVLDNPGVRSLQVIEVMAPVIDWHRRGLVPLGKKLSSDPRCTLVHADFFACAASDVGFDHAESSRLAHAVLLDIDHSPSQWLAPGNRSFYSVAGLQDLARKLHPGGIFGMWSNDPPEKEFTRLLEAVFPSSEYRIVTFPNRYSGGESSSTIYLAYNSQ